jgi:hypothetical protein
MMVKGFDDDAEWSDVKTVAQWGKDDKEREIQLVSECTINYSPFPLLILFRLSIYLLYVDSLKVPSLSPRIKPDLLLRRSRGLMMLVLVLHFNERQKRK